MEGNLRFKIDWASLIVGRKFTVFALFYFVFEGNFQVQAPGRGGGGGFYLEGFCVTSLGAYIWRAYFLNFTATKWNLINGLGMAGTITTKTKRFT